MKNVRIKGYACLNKLFRNVLDEVAGTTNVLMRSFEEILLFARYVLAGGYNPATAVQDFYLRMIAGREIRKANRLCSPITLLLCKVYLFL